MNYKLYDFYFDVGGRFFASQCKDGFNVGVGSYDYDKAFYPFVGEGIDTPNDSFFINSEFINSLFS
ncbi:MAG: hypothetical protein Q4P18_07975 [Methanobrevibacter sp.]|uniref:hypothetical protein n=1 Tax=Methanobrevibacter sp. TaxID=66852 RepID=UPI0026E0D595|nr:hypothetical protein [Methanobrevibacter sp.]MDO5849458.1 hypothetical protein [Methanobrevibacter sp.]